MSTSPRVSRGHGLLQLLVIGLVVFTTRASLADHYTVPSGSMEPTIAVGDRLAVNKFAYGLRVPLTQTWLTQDPPQRGDVVVFTHPSEDTVLVKRLVGMPGDVLAFDGTFLSINGRRVEQDRLPDGSRVERLPGMTHPLHASDWQGPPQPALRIPEGRYFMMGDHRGDSADSRAFGLVPRENLLGRAVAVAWSPRRDVAGREHAWIPLSGDAHGFDPRLSR